MKARIAVATVSGRAYYLIVNELKRKNIPFLSITPHEPVPIEIKVVITTEEEKRLINHERVLAYKPGIEPSALVTEAMRIVQGKEAFEKVIIGIDPPVSHIACLGSPEIHTPWHSNCRICISR